MDFAFAFPPRTLIDSVELAALAMSAALFLFLPFELWRTHRQGKLKKQYWLEMAANLSTLVPTIITAGLSATFIIWLYGIAASIAPWDIKLSLPTVIVAILLVDFIYYWDHRFAHRVGILWAAMHSVHHSSPIFNQTTAIRISFVDGFISPIYYTIPVLMGFDPLLIVAALGFNLGYQQWIHTENIGKLGWFDRWFNSPSNHRVHHGRQEQYLDKNYGGIFMVWDRMFGTYQAEEEKPDYGLTEAIGSVNPLAVHGVELGRLWRKICRSKGWRPKLRLLIKPPGGTTVIRNQGTMVVNR